MFRTFTFAWLIAIALIATTGVAGADTVEFTTDLSGENEVGDPGDADGSGTATVTIDSDTAEVCFSITTSGTEDPVAGHIHEGAAGANGGVVVDSDWTANAGEGCVAGDAAVVAAILANPSGYYVNVHTPEFPAGAIRGQLASGGQLAATGPSMMILLLGSAAVLIVAGASG